MRFIFGAMAQKRHSRTLAQRLQKTKGEFLAVVLDSRIALINGVAFVHLLSIPTTELTPTDQAGLKGSQQLFARPDVRHPDIKPGCAHSTTPKPRHQDSQSVLAGFDWGKYRFRLNHSSHFKTPLRTMMALIRG